MKLIPAIDIIGGKCVRLSKGVYDSQKVYSNNPLETAKKFEAHGLQYLHLVDLDGAKHQHIVNHKILEDICQKTSLTVDFGGGIKSDDDARIAFECGAKQITVGSIAVKNPELVKKWLAAYGSEKIILGADAKSGKIATQGWLEHSQKDIVPFIASYKTLGIRYVISTDIDKDGMLQGPSTDLYQTILKTISGIRLIASGGVSSYSDIISLEDVGCYGAIIGKAIYEGLISLKDIEHYISKNSKYP